MPGLRASDGVELHVEVHGEGPAVVLSCAYCTTCENFRPQVETLTAAGYRVAIWDYRGHGRSQVPERDESYSMAQVVDDLGRVVDRASPDAPAVVGGLSFGGLASLHLALARPDRVRALLLLDSGPGFKNPEAQARWQQQVERTARFVLERGMREFVRGRAGPTLVGRLPDLPAARAAAAAIEAQDPAGLARFGRRVAGPAEAVLDRLPEVRVPALVLVGAEDAPYLRAAEVMAARLPAARHRVLEGAGHIGNLEQREAFDRALLDFLREVAPPGRDAGAAGDAA